MPPLPEKALRPSSAGTRVEPAGQKTHQIGHGLGLENHRIGAWLDGFGLPRAHRLVHRLGGDVLGIEAREVVMITREIPGARAVVTPRGDAECRFARPEVAAIAVHRGCRRRGRARSMKAGARHFGGAARPERGLERLCACREIDLGRRGREPARFRIGERPERWYVLSMQRRDPGDLHGLLRQTFERLCARVVCSRGAAPLADPHGGRDVQILGTSARRDPVVGEAGMRLDGIVECHRGVLRTSRLGVRKHGFADCERLVPGQHQ